MPRELYNLVDDPHETRDRLSGEPDESSVAIADELEAILRGICDPEAVDAQAKADQKTRAEEFGGNEKIATMGAFSRTPPPGTEAQMHAVKS